MPEVYFATNRDLLESNGRPEFGNEFHHLGRHFLRFGWAAVDKQPDGSYAATTIDLAPERIPERAGAQQMLGSPLVFERLRARMSEEACDVLCLIHGYASSFETALARAGELADDYSTAERKVVVFVFSWPANGRMVPFLDYVSDRDDAEASALAIARAFHRLCDFLNGLGEEEQCRRAIHLMAHSMGNWALRHAVLKIDEMFNGAPPRMFDQILLMAADEDNDAFEHNDKLRRLPRLGKAVHVYFSPDDRALMVSDTTKFNPDRLGATGPNDRELLPRKVVLVDCRMVDEPDHADPEAPRRDLSVHQYYRLRAEVIQDVQQVLAGTLPSRIPGREFLPDDRSFVILPFEERDS